MTTSLDLWCFRGYLTAAAILLTTAPSDAAGTRPAPQDTSADVLEISRGNHMILTIGSIRRVDGSLSASTIDRRGVLARSIMVHRVRIDLLEGADSATPKRTIDWRADATVYVSGKALVQLGSAAPELSLPKPLGVLVRAGDTLRIVASVTPSSTASTDVWVRLTVDCEPADGPVTQLPVVMVEAVHAESVSGDPARRDRDVESWTWTSEIGGRALAFTGSDIELAVEVSLADVTTGEVLWREMQQGDGPGFARSHCVRIGAAMIHRDHVYRLTVRYASPIGPSSATDRPSASGVRVLVLPDASIDSAGRLHHEN